MTAYYKARRAKPKPKKNKVITFLIFLFIIIAIIYIFISNKFWNIQHGVLGLSTEQNNEIEGNVTEELVVAQAEEQIQEVVDVSNIPDKMGNYEVLGQLVIEKIGLRKNILSILDDKSLKLSVAQLCGPKLSESGNFCICGHNWNTMLKRLSEMQIGDTLYIVNKQTKAKVNYEIYNMYTCVPTDLSCLDDNNDGKRELTIITCNPGGATRLICKAREISMF